MMSQHQEQGTRKRGGFGLLKFYLSQKIIKILLILVVVAAVIFGVRKTFFTESKTTKLGFEDIGELATQCAYTTEVGVQEGSRELFGIQIPFTQSKYIYSMDFEIKAGIDFGDIDWDLKDKIIEVRLPEARILSSEMKQDSFQVYHEEESIFRQIRLEEINDGFEDMQKQAEKDAVSNGLLENAKSNAETILKEFFAKEYDLKEYKITFREK